MKKTWIAAIAVGLVGLLGTSSQALETGTAAPDFTLTDTSGQEHNLSDFKGKYVVLEWVNYGGLPDSPYYDLAKKYTNGKPSALLTFGIKGGFDAGVKFYDALDMFLRLVNIGDVKSLAAHPASTTHRQLTDDELKTAGVTPDMIRLCVGIEHIDDILADIDQALAAAA